MGDGSLRTLIIGFGTVGSNLSHELARLCPDVCDKYKGIDERHGHYDVAFVCVDTPLSGSTLDVTEVEAAIRENDADVYVIKSTVLPGTTDRIREETGKRVVFSPEYYGSTQHANGRDRTITYDFTILGGEKADCVQVVQLLQEVYDGRHSFRITDAKTAELTKLMENSWIATKVSFCNQFADIAEQCGVCYEELRELFLCDPRVSPFHTYNYRNHSHWDSHCLNKDVPALAHAYDAPLLDAVIAFNAERKLSGKID